MKTALKSLLDEFYDFSLPDLTRRKTEFPLIPHKSTVIIGMRRTGKTWQPKESHQVEYSI